MFARVKPQMCRLPSGPYYRRSPLKLHLDHDLYGRAAETPRCRGATEKPCHEPRRRAWPPSHGARGTGPQAAVRLHLHRGRAAVGRQPACGGEELGRTRRAADAAGSFGLPRQAPPHPARRPAGALLLPARRAAVAAAAADLQLRDRRDRGWNGWSGRAALLARARLPGAVRHAAVGASVRRLRRAGAPPAPLPPLSRAAAAAVGRLRRAAVGALRGEVQRPGGGGLRLVVEGDGEHACARARHQLAATRRAHGLRARRHALLLRHAGSILLAALAQSALPPHAADAAALAHAPRAHEAAARAAASRARRQATGPHADGLTVPPLLAQRHAAHPHARGPARAARPL
eukprot:scaffold80708_cov75-Phaeocystis_antarctica.AAC.7